MLGIRSFANETSPGVFHCNEWGHSLTMNVVELLTVEARRNPRLRARLCMHPNLEDAEQQMLIVMASGAVDAPHMHPVKTETMIPVAGDANYEIFDAKGCVQESILLGPNGSMYISSPVGVYHRLVLLGDVFAFWEFSSGPFTRSSTVPAPWSDPLHVGSEI